MNKECQEMGAQVRFFFRETRWQKKTWQAKKEVGAKS